MKNYFASLMITICLFSCTRHIDKYENEQDKEWFRVSAIGADTSQTPWMLARTEAAIVMAEDSKLKAELIAYQPTTPGYGKYTIKMTNKQACQVNLRWNWEGLTIDSMAAQLPAIDPGSDVLKANEVITFILWGDSKVGKITVKAEGNDCGNSSTLVIPITLSVLPIKYINHSTTRDKSGKVTVSFAIDDPSIIDWFIIDKMTGTKVSQAALISCDKLTKSYSIKL
jgi:hypothetical protein